MGNECTPRWQRFIHYLMLPHAISCVLVGQDVASAKIKGCQRRALLVALGLDTMVLTWTPPCALSRPNLF